MAVPILRSFTMGDDAMLERAQVFHDRLVLELPDFTARFPWLDPVWQAAFQNDITAADAFPKDESVTLDIKVLTGDVKGAMQQGYAALQTLGGYARLAYPNDVARQRVFGQQYWTAARKSTLKLQEALELAYAKADEATLKTALLDKGYTQVGIDQINSLATELQTKNGLQEAAKAGRKVTSQDRISLLNIVWDHMRTVNICADVVWANDAGRREQYQLYPSTGGGNGGDGPTTGFFGNVTDTLGNTQAGATVRLSNAEGMIETQTDINGNYNLPVPDVESPVNGTLTVETAGMMPSSRPVTITPGEEQEQNFVLSPMAPPPAP